MHNRYWVLTLKIRPGIGPSKYREYHIRLYHLSFGWNTLECCIWFLVLTACFRYFSQSYKEINYWPGFHHSDCLADPCKFSLWPERFIFWFWKRCNSIDRRSASDKRRFRWFELWFNSGISCHRRLWNRLPRNPREYEAESLRSRIHLSLQSSAVPQ